MRVTVLINDVADSIVADNNKAAAQDVVETTVKHNAAENVSLHSIADARDEATQHSTANENAAANHIASENPAERHSTADDDADHSSNAEVRDDHNDNSAAVNTTDVAQHTIATAGKGSRTTRSTFDRATART